jgi:hypothetical protein
VRFYGGTPLAWLRETPMGVIRAHVEMMPRLTAEEALLVTQATALGSRSIKLRASTARTILLRWDRAARSRRRGASARATPGHLQAIGIACTVIERPGGNGG